MTLARRPIQMRASERISIKLSVYGSKKVDRGTKDRFRIGKAENFNSFKKKFNAAEFSPIGLQIRLQIHTKTSAKSGGIIDCLATDKKLHRNRDGRMACVVVVIERPNYSSFVGRVFIRQQETYDSVRRCARI